MTAAPLVIGSRSGRWLAFRPTVQNAMQCRALAIELGAVLLTDAYLVHPDRAMHLLRAAVSHGLAPAFTKGAADVLLVRSQQLHEQEQWLDNLNLYPYQNDGVAFLWKKRNALLADEMGLGKTVQALCALPPDAAAVVVCHPVMMLDVWKAECLKWRKDLRPVLLRDEDSSAFRWPEPGELVITSYTKLPSVDARIGPPPEGVCLIGDEIHCCKKYNTKRTERMAKLVRTTNDADGFVIGLTGTPVLNHPGELWTITRTLGIAQQIWPHRAAFAKDFGGKLDMYGADWNPEEIKPHAIDKFKGFILRRTVREVLQDLPTETIREVVVEPEWSHVADCNGARPKWMEYAAEALDEWTIGDEDNRALGDSEVMRTRRALAEAKIPAMMQLLDGYLDAGATVVVFSAHRAPIDFLHKTCGYPVLHGDVKPRDRVKIVEDFQAGKYPVLGATVQVAGTGITLTRASHSLFVDQSFVPAANDQARARLVRIGQTRGVLHTMMVANDPFDIRCAEILAAKVAIIQSTTDKMQPERRLTNLRLSDTLGILARKVLSNGNSQ